jgi:hypothetical protein
MSARFDLIARTGAIRAASGLLRRAERLVAEVSDPHRTAFLEATAAAQAALAAALTTISVRPSGTGGAS